jgi:KDO2-lipid IV(A) lauroyltransferase
MATPDLAHDKVTLADAAEAHVEGAVPLAATLAIAALRVIGALPLSVRRAIGSTLGALAGTFPSRERTIATLQLQYFLPELSPETLARRTFAHAGKTLMESLNLKPLLTDSSNSIICPQWNELEALFKGERPTIVLTGHTGNWDLLAAYTIARGIDVATVGREARSPILQQLLRSIRDGYGINTIWRSDKAGIKKLISLLKAGKVVAALIDQDTRVESVPIPFFGESAKTPSSLIALGKRHNASFITIFLFRTSPSTYEVFAEQLDDSLSTDEVLQTYNQRLETLIRRFPEQWVWFHKRWRTSADGVTKSSREYIAWLREKIAP